MLVPTSFETALKKYYEFWHLSNFFLASLGGMQDLSPQPEMESVSPALGACVSTTDHQGYFHVILIQLLLFSLLQLIN